MPTIDDVISWANTLPRWQGDAVRRLLIAGENPLSPEDYAGVLALAKADLKLAPTPSTVEPIFLLQVRSQEVRQPPLQSNWSHLTTSRT